MPTELTSKGVGLMLWAERTGRIRRRSLWVRLNHWFRFGIPMR